MLYRRWRKRKSRGWGSERATWSRPVARYTACATRGSPARARSVASARARWVVHRVDSEFQPVADPGLVVDAAQVILDYLLLGGELFGDLPVLPAFGDERNDLDFLRCKALEHPPADAIGQRH